MSNFKIWLSLFYEKWLWDSLCGFVLVIYLLLPIHRPILAVVSSQYDPVNRIILIRCKHVHCIYRVTCWQHTETYLQWILLWYFFRGDGRSECTHARTCVCMHARTHAHTCACTHVLTMQLTSTHPKHTGADRQQRTSTTNMTRG